MGADASDAGELVFDAEDACVWRSGERIPLPPKAFEVLNFLLARPDRLAAKAELLDAVWPDTHVTEAVLAVAIGQLREAFADDAKHPRFIETVHRRGYRWIGGQALRQPAAASAAAIAPHRQAPLGREAELARLRTLLQRASAGDRQIVFVAGESGIGKTTLVDAFVREAADASWSVARGQCVDAYGAGEAYMPVLEALEGLCRAAATRDTIDVLRSEAPTWLLQMPGLLTSAESQDLERRLAASTRERMIREMLRALEVITSRRPLLLVLEDMHWSDHATTALLGALAARRDSARLVVVVTLRPVDAIAHLHPVVPLMRELVGKQRASEIALHGLVPGDVACFLDVRLSPNRFPAALAERLCAQTGGNPLFVIHAVEDFVQRGWFKMTDDHWGLAVDLADLEGAIPNSTREMIELRLDGLAPDVARMLEAASLDGVMFNTQCVAAATGRDLAEIELECSRLVRAGSFLGAGTTVRWPDGSTGGQYSFGHALYRQVLESRVSPAAAAVMHGRIGAHMAAGYAGQSAEVAAQLATHFERAGDSERAVAQRLDAARVAASRNASAEAIEHLQIALAAVETWPAGSRRDSAELGLRAALLPPMFAIQGATSEALSAAARRVEALSDGGALTVASLQANWVLMGFHTTRGEFGVGRSICERVLAACDHSPLGAMAGAVARGQRGFCRVMLADYEGAIGDLEPSLALPSLLSVAPVEPAVMACGNLGLARLLLGDPDAGFALVEEGWTRAEATSHAPTLSWASATAMRAAMLGGRVDAASVAAARAGDIAEKFAVDRWRGLAAIGRGWCDAMGGDDAGIATLSSARARLAACGFLAFDLLHAALEAGLLLRFGRVDEAAALLDRTTTDRGFCDEKWCDAEVLRLRGEIHARRRPDR